MKEIEVSVVLPCLNEEETIKLCINKALKAFKENNIIGEIIVSDNGSTDRSVAIAKKAGARVVHQPLRGYGNAYLKGFAEARGKYLVMADADNTYPLEQIPEFIAPLRKGKDFVIGDRLNGTILPGAMPWLHRWIGNPILSGILRVLFRTNIKDSHCGMRAFTREAYQRMNLRTTGMEFASEMVIKAVDKKVKIAQIPITYYPRTGSPSKLHSFRDGWRHLRFMLLYSPLHLFVFPGMLLWLLGMFTLGLFLLGPVTFFGITMQLYPMFLGTVLVMLGHQIIVLGLFTRVYRYTSHLTDKDDGAEFLIEYLSVDKGLLISAGVFLAGLLLAAWTFMGWTHTGNIPMAGIRYSIFALTLMVLGIQTAFASWFFSVLGVKHK